MDLQLPQSNSQDDNQDLLVKDGAYQTPFNVDIGPATNKLSLTSYISRIKELPQKLINLLTDFSTAEFIEENLGIKYNLNKGQKAEITRLIRNVVLSDLYLGDLPAQITVKLGIEPNQARTIYEYIFDNLFNTVMEDLRLVQKNEFKKFPDSFRAAEVNQQKIDQEKIISQPQASPAPSSASDLPASTQELPDKFKVTPPPPPNPQQSTEHYQGEGLPESNGNVIDLRNLK